MFVEDKDLSIVAALPRGRAAPSASWRSRVFLDAARAHVDAGRLRLMPGACMLELLPATSWHKGSALEWIRERVERLHGPTFTVYIGDDVTDEDAFEAVGLHGMTIGASERVTLRAEFQRRRSRTSVERLLHSSEWPSESITVAHSPDSDDAFMFYGLARGTVDTGGIEVDQVLSDIETLNRAAFEASTRSRRFRSMPSRISRTSTRCCRTAPAWATTTARSSSRRI